MKPVLDIIIPTFNNPNYLLPCLNSIHRIGVINNGRSRVLVINNGLPGLEKSLAHYPNVITFTPGSNLGWEGGLAYGLERSEAPFVCFQNDDTYIPPTSSSIYNRLLTSFSDPDVGLVGPTTTVSSGVQCIYNPNCPPIEVGVRWLIFFLVMGRREYIDKVGGIDQSLPGGDDFDLSIRMRKAGYKVRLSPAAFIIHHGFKTGIRVHGDSNVAGGWNSAQMTDRTNQALIRKHGFQTFYETISKQIDSMEFDAVDHEGELIQSFVNSADRVLELGCGHKKTVPQAIGVDLIEKGGVIPISQMSTSYSVADVAADVTKDLPFEDESFDVVIARHIIEHCVDLVSAITNWKRYLRPGGKLIIATPNEEVCHGIPLDPTHVHTFTPQSLKSILELLGFKETHSADCRNGISMFSVFEKLKIESPVEVPV